jgi:hypothetical protein
MKINRIIAYSDRRVDILDVGFFKQDISGFITEISDF